MFYILSIIIAMLNTILYGILLNFGFESFGARFGMVMLVMVTEILIVVALVIWYGE